MSHRLVASSSAWPIPGGEGLVRLPVRTQEFRRDRFSGGDYADLAATMLATIRAWISTRTPVTTSARNIRKRCRTRLLPRATSRNGNRDRDGPRTTVVAAAVFVDYPSGMTQNDAPAAWRPPGAGLQQDLRVFGAYSACVCRYWKRPGHRNLIGLTHPGSIRALLAQAEPTVLICAASGTGDRDENALNITLGFLFFLICAGLVILGGRPK